jgi:molecular chaperone HscA
MLMQIAEPGESKVKEACKPRVVGIDLGTTNSLVAHVADAAPEVIGGDGGPLVPSVVHYTADGGVIIGRPAQARAFDAHAHRAGSTARRRAGRSPSSTWATSSTSAAVERRGRFGMGCGRPVRPCTSCATR